MEVDPEDKKSALQYLECLGTLWMARHGLFMWRQFPLLEGLQALYQSKLIFGHGTEMDFIDLQEAIERLPTKPQTERSSSNASD
jgi:hypothetical protein